MPSQKKCKYIKFYNFLLPTKRKNKNGLMKDNVKIENTKIRVIKQERIWNDNREEKNGEKEKDDMCCNYESSLREELLRWLLELPTLLRRSHSHSISFGTTF